MDSKQLRELFKENANGKVETNDKSIIQVMDEDRFVSIVKQLDTNEKSTLHDVLYDLDIIEAQDWKSVKNHFEMLPDDIVADGVRWGYDDSVVRDNMYVFFKNLNK
jgi:hypothetical protein